MKKVLSILLVTLILATFTVWVQAQDVPLKNGWGLGYSVTVPLVKMHEAAANSSAKMEAEAIMGLGGGPAFNWRSASDPAGDPIVTIIPVMFIMATPMDGSQGLNISAGPVVGFFGNTFQVGCVYYFGQLAVERSRFETVFTVGPGIVKTTTKAVNGLIGAVTGVVK